MFEPRAPIRCASRRVGVCPATTAWVVGVCLTLSAGADQFVLSQGGAIEGQVIEETADALRVRTATGVVDIPAVIVARRDRGASRFEAYSTLRDAAPLTLDRHLELANWCRQERFTDLAAEHVREALALDPMHVEARGVAGFVRLGDVWLDASIDGRAGAIAQRDRRIVEQLVNGWHRRMRAIHDDFLTGTRRESRDTATGRQMLAAMRSPLAIPAACRFLYGETPEVRRILAEYLGAFDEDLASLNLFAIALLDDDADVRASAAVAMRRRQDTRTVDVMRAALRCNVDEVVRRAALVLGQLGDRAAVADLIDALPTDGPGAAQLSLRALIEEATRTFSHPISVALTDTTRSYPSGIILPDFSRTVDAVAGRAGVASGRHRSEVQEALIAITGENFGFDTAAWRDWLRRHPPIPMVTP